MKRSFIIIISIFAVILTACGRYKTYPTAEKITLISETTEPPTEQVTELSKTDTVYYTKTGERYHLNNSCGKGTYYKCTLDEALENGLTPCRRCVE